MSQSGNFHQGGGGTAGQANVQDVSLTKWLDKASTKLMLHCLSGEHIPEATLTVRKAGGAKPIDYFKIVLTDVLVSSVSTGGSGGEDRLTESVSLHFAKMKADYSLQKKDGSATPAGNVSWDVAKNKK